MMKNKAIITYLLSFALLLSACMLQSPSEAQGLTRPVLHNGESTALYESIEYSLPTETLSSLPTKGEDDIYNLFALSCDVGPYSFRYGYFYVGSEIIYGWTLTDCAIEVEYAVIPEEVMGIPVVAIGMGTEVFSMYHAIKKIVIPETVQYIDKYAFQGCKTLEDITLPSGIKYIGYYAFKDCPGLKELRITPDMKLDYSAVVRATGLEKVIIEEGVTYIPYFYGCCSLTELQLPSTITRIGTDNSVYNASNFYQTKITFLELPEGLTYLGWYVFTNSKIESVILPSTLTESYTDTFDTEALKYVFFRGTEDQLLDNVRETIHAPIYFYSETEPTEEGNFWHYVDGKPVIW